MPRKVAESHSVAYFNDPVTLEAHGLEEAGFYIIEDKESENSTHVDAEGNEYSVRHESNPVPVRRVFPAPDGEDGFVYGEDDGEDGEDE
jgi:hypothetical protein